MEHNISYISQYQLEGLHLELQSVRQLISQISLMIRRELKVCFKKCQETTTNHVLHGTKRCASIGIESTDIDRIGMLLKLHIFNQKADGIGQNGSVNLK